MKTHCDKCGKAVRALASFVWYYGYLYHPECHKELQDKQELPSKPQVSYR